MRAIAQRVENAAVKSAILAADAVVNPAPQPRHIIYHTLLSRYTFKTPWCKTFGD